MKKIIFSLAIILCTSIQGQAQQQEYRTCDTDFKWEEAIKLDPSAAQKNAELREFRKLFISSSAAKKSVSSTGVISYRIPIVFHVIHAYGSENISKAQILDAMEILNQSFQKLNSDTGIVIPLFQPIFANCEIEIVLANLDPSGNCTDGITRTYSTLTASAGDNVKALINWPSNKYFNVWVVGNIASGAAGYAYYPGISANIDGVVMRHDYVGGIGTSNSSNYTERSLAHEVGHWLDLPHTWGSTNFPGVASNCNSDDGIGDTPNTIGTANFSCNTAQSTCGAIDNVQNYMDYASCHYMFTEGQKAAMHAALNSSVGNRDNLSTPSNWLATGTEIGRTIQSCVPVADFSVRKRGVCSGTTISFKDVSWNGEVTSRTWSFPGGTPATDTSAIPSVTYSTPGIYNVTLTVSNALGTDILTRNGLVEVLPTTGTNSIPYSEDFETLTFPTNDWAINNPGNNNPWILTTSAGASGTKSLRLTNHSGNAPGSIDEVITPTYNLSGVSGTLLNFNYAFAAKNNNDSSEIKVFYSTTCGDIWTQRFAKKGVSLRTAANTTASFIPAANEWASATVNLVSGSISGKPSVRFKFQFTNVNANNFYIDDINITGTVGTPEAIALNYEFEVFPNPAKDFMQMSLNLKQAEEIKIELLDVTGRLISVKTVNAQTGVLQTEIDNKGMNGIYLLRITVNEGQFTKRVVFIP